MEAAGGRGRQEPEEEEGTLSEEAVAEPQQEVAAEVAGDLLSAGHQLGLPITDG